MTTDQADNPKRKRTPKRGSQDIKVIEFQSQPNAEPNPFDQALKASKEAYDSTRNPSAEPKASKATSTDTKASNSPNAESKSSKTPKQHRSQKDKQVSRLTKQPYWHSFAESLLQGHNQADALRLARPHLAATWDRASIVAEASRLADDPRVVAHIAAEQSRRSAARRKREAALMDNLERREVCREVAFAEDSNGLTKLAAVKTDAQLAGEWLERQEVSSTVSLSALLAELPQSGLPIARAQPVVQAIEVEPAQPIATHAAQALPNQSSTAWELVED